MKLGIGSYTYMWSIGFSGARPVRPMDAHELLQKTIDFGVHVAQFGPNLPLSKLDVQELRDLAAKAQAAGIDIEHGSSGTLFPELESQLKIARMTGATFLRSVQEKNDGGIASMEEFTEQLQAAAPLLARAGVRLGIENALVPARDLAKVLESVGSPWIGVTLDTVNSLAIPEGTREVVRILAPYVFCLHVKDFQIERVWHRMGFQVEGRPAGAGMLNVPALLDALASAGVSPNVILELWPPEQSSLQETIALEHKWAVESVQYLRKYIHD